MPKVNTRAAAENAIQLLAQFHKPEGFDHKGFLDEMTARSIAAHGRKLNKGEMRDLARLVSVYQSHH